MARLERVSTIIQREYERTVADVQDRFGVRVHSDLSRGT